MRIPDPKVMREVFNSPNTLKKLSDAISSKTSDKTVKVGNKIYIVKTSSSSNSNKD